VDWPLVVPLTVALNAIVPPVVVEAFFGNKFTVMTGITVTVAVSLLDVSATLVATTWKVPVFAGALYFPDASTAPPPASGTDHVTLGVAAPVTAAVNATVPRKPTVVWCGVTVTETAATGITPPGLQPGARAPAAVRKARAAMPRTCICRLQSGPPAEKHHRKKIPV